MGQRHLGGYEGLEGAESLEVGTGGGEGIAGGGSLHFRMFIEVGVDSGLPEIGFDVAEATETPFVRNECVDEGALSGSAGLYCSWSSARSSAVSSNMIWDSAWMPRFKALKHDFAFPSEVVGTCDFCL
jgi:hypothetical protein